MNFLKTFTLDDWLLILICMALCWIIGILVEIRDSVYSVIRMLNAMANPERQHHLSPLQLAEMEWGKKDKDSY